MASTFATLRALQLVIADALDDIHRVFSLSDPPSSPPSPSSSPVCLDPDRSPTTTSFPATPPASFPPTPLSATFSSPPRSPPHIDAGLPRVDYPSPDLPLVPNSPSEQLAMHPDVAAAASRIVAACGQMSSIVHNPFSSICDAMMSYNLAACLRLVEHLHIAEIIREAEESRQMGRSTGQGSEAAFPLYQESNFAVSRPTLGGSTRGAVAGFRTHTTIEGLHIADITDVIYSYTGANHVDPNNLVHALRLLSTHHIFRETAPDTFALTRVASLLDSGKSVKVVFSNPDTKYDDAGEIPSLVALTTDEIFKSAAYLTEAFTGVQLPTVSTSSPSFPVGTATIPTFDIVVNDTAACISTTRSSSVLTHIVYPEDEDIASHSSFIPAVAPMADDTPISPKNIDVPFQQLAVEPSVSLPSGRSPIEASTELEEEHPRREDAVRQERIPAFNLAFRTTSPFFEWLENGGKDPLGGTGQGACMAAVNKGNGVRHGDVQPNGAFNCVSRKSFRLERFSKAMAATTLWEAPRAILNVGFNWHSLPKGSTIVDVGGGIGSTTMTLARALNDRTADTSLAVPRHRSKMPSDPSLMGNDVPRDSDAVNHGLNLHFVVQDRPVVTVLGVEAWRSKCPELLESGQVAFQDHDFFEPQPPLEFPHLSRHPAIYILRVVLHDWSDECARRILINLRVASNPETRLIIAEHVLPLACVDEDVDHVRPGTCSRGLGRPERWTLNSVLANVEGAESTLVPPPLLSNLGKASANAYFMDLVMHIMFNSKERTLREFCALALSAGWRVTRMTRPEGTLFAYLVCEPITLPDDAQEIYNAVVLSSELSTVVAVPSDEPATGSRTELSRLKQLPPRPVSLLPSPIFDRPSSRCGTPTFGSRLVLPNDDELQGPRARGARAAKKWFKSKGLGVRGLAIQKAEKREEQSLAKSVSARDNDDAPDEIRASSSQMRVWWKKSPPNSAGNSGIAIHEFSGQVPEQHATGRGWRRPLLASDSPAAMPSPRASPVHQKWSSIESATLLTPEGSSPVTRPRRPSVASITRKLSFATFGRRPSVPDIAESLPTPPLSATMTDLAPSPNLRDDIGRSLKHLPSLPTLRRPEVTSNRLAGRPAIPRRPSFTLASQEPPLQSILKSTVPRRPDIPEPPIILKSPKTGKQLSPGTGPSSEPLAQRPRRVTMSNSPSVPSRVPVQAPPAPAGPEMKRMPSMPRLPRRLSIPMLRRKQSQPVIRGGGSEG